MKRTNITISAVRPAEVKVMKVLENLLNRDVESYFSYID
jgi:hypothetical protein